MSLWVPECWVLPARERVSERTRGLWFSFTAFAESNFNPLLQAHMCVSMPHLWAFSYVNRLLFTVNPIKRQHPPARITKFNLLWWKWDRRLQFRSECHHFVSINANALVQRKFESFKAFNASRSWSANKKQTQNTPNSAPDSNSNIVLKGSHNMNKTKQNNYITKCGAQHSAHSTIHFDANVCSMRIRMEKREREH